ncbi:MAG: LysR substrate-binding domain-containing protein [Deltaproteobacteria bacterium]|nr:LysR substrate-binding domain-containing protein [Deltaproteobacteria bacterium]
MEWQQLLGFYHVARLGSFTRAARATFRTQSALSQQVRALEEELECQLLERLGKRQLRLTPAGEKLLEFSQAVLARLEAFKEELHELKGQNQGTLRLAAPFTTLYHLLPEFLERYRREFPKVDVTLLDRSQAAVVALVKAGEVDFGLALESQITPDLAALRWQPVHTVLLAPRHHPLAMAKRLTLRQIAAHPLILPPRGPDYPGRRVLDEHFRRHGLTPHIVMESANVELSALYVEMGLGVAFATLARDLPAPAWRHLAFLPPAALL